MARRRRLPHRSLARRISANSRRRFARFLSIAARYPSFADRCSAGLRLRHNAAPAGTHGNSDASHVYMSIATTRNPDLLATVDEAKRLLGMPPGERRSQPGTWASGGSYAAERIGSANVIHAGRGQPCSTAIPPRVVGEPDRRDEPPRHERDAPLHRCEHTADDRSAKGRRGEDATTTSRS